VLLVVTHAAPSIRLGMLYAIAQMNSADRRSLQFAVNEIVYRYKIFGAVSKNLHIEISAHLGIESVENLVANRRNRFSIRYGETVTCVKCCAGWFVCLGVGPIFMYCICLMYVC